MALIRATDVVEAGSQMPAAFDRVRLDHDRRHRRRLLMTTLGGTEFLLDLPAARLLKHGDGLRLEDGRVVAVEAEPEALLEIRIDGPGALTRIAWHLGNRHLPTVVEPNRLLIRRDHVIAHMLAGLGARVTEVVEVFDPQGGAYEGQGPAGHDHHHPHDHHHDGHRHG